MELLPGIFIRQVAGKGNGVFTSRAIPAGTVVELSPVIVMTGEERKLLDRTLLHDYIFEWKAGGEDKCCMAQGYVSVYNHSAAANCEYFMDYETQTILVKTVRAVDAGEELTFNYNGDWDNGAPVWFETI